MKSLSSLKHMSKDELTKINGGGIWEMLEAYYLAAGAFIYTLGKDGKSAVSYQEPAGVDGVSYG